MITLAEARRRWQEIISQYQQVQQIRSAVLGDGRGTATSNLFVPNRDNYVFARDDVSSTRYFQILNRGVVQPHHNLPVLIGFPEPGESDQEEQIISMHYAGLGDIPASTIPIVGPHHQQHEWHGGDEVFIDPLQFLPGLVYPTYPSSMIANVRSFIYFWDTWQRFPFTQTDDLTQFKPSSGQVRYVLIALDPEADILVYRPGVPYATGTQEIIYDLFTPVPAPAGNEIPLGYVKLASTTTVIDWSSVVDNMRDARLFPTTPALHLLDRIKQLEGLSGNPPDLMMMGSASSPDSGDNTLNGLADVDTAGVVNDQTLFYSNGLWIPGNAAGTGTVVGTGVANRVAYWDGTSSINDSANFTFDGTTVGIGTLPSTQHSLSIAHSFVSVGDMGISLAISGTGTTGYGIYIEAASGAPTTLYGIFTTLTQTFGPTTAIAGYFTSNGTATNSAGIQIVESSSATANIGLLVGAHPGGSTNYAAHLASANQVYLGSGNVGVNTVIPATRFEVVDATTAGTRGITATNYTSNVQGGLVLLRHGRNTEASPQAINTSDQLGIFAYQGHSGSGTTFNTGASIRALALENFSTTAAGSQVIIATAAVTTLTVTDCVTIGPGVQVGAPTGGDKGSGTINAAGAYWANGTTGVSAGSFSTITAITATNGLVTQLTGSSDARLKTVLSHFESGLEALRGIVPEHYLWNETSGFNDGREHIGFIAQNVRGNLPMAIGTEKWGDGREWLTVDDRTILATVVNAVNELCVRIEKLEK